MSKDIYDKTIEDFGEEWNLYQYSEENEEIKYLMIILIFFLEK